MSFAISRSELEATFGAGGLVVVPAEQLNASVTHAETRRFLTEVGLPLEPAFLSDPVGSLHSGLMSADSFAPEFDAVGNLPETAGSWVALGYCDSDMLFLDGATGVVWTRPEGELHVRFANCRIDLFARFSASFFRVLDDFGEGVTLQNRKNTAERLIAEFRAADPRAVADPENFWNVFLDSLVHDYPNY